MKFSTSTLDVLRNFANINDSIILRDGNIITTMSESRFIVARAEIAETIPVVAPFYKSLDRVIRLIKLFDQPELEFEDSRLVISSGKFKQYLRYSKPELILAPKSDPATKHFDWNFSFDLLEKDFALLEKAANISNSPHIVFECNGQNSPIRVTARDVNESSSNEHILELEATCADSFKIIFLRENFKMIPADYRVSVHMGDNKVSHWKRSGDGKSLEYWCAIEMGSTYG